MKDAERSAKIRAFVQFWRGKGDEKGQCQPFWLALLRDVCGVENPEKIIEFEDRVLLEHASFIDGYIPETKVLIEQKKLGADLYAAIRQSDGSVLSPFEQAKRYADVMPYSRIPRWIVTCNFEQFNVYDREHPNAPPETIFLKDLEKEYSRLQFLVDPESVRIKKETKISIKAGKLVGKLYDLLVKQYINPESEESQRSLNMLCVRLVFCLYAEDAGIFAKRKMFHDYLAHIETDFFRCALIKLFKVLDQKPEERDPYLLPRLAAFPYVNGGLFSDENIEIPNFTEEIRALILSEASADDKENATEVFDWSGISPTIFGAVFESTLNPETRRAGGMHYTSPKNIHKVIDPLFLDDLKKELDLIEKERLDLKTLAKRVDAFQKKLAALKFLDPACGSGNFLTETYLSLRSLENRALSLLHAKQGVFGATNPIRVSIDQFYGIEINDFAVAVARTALWIAESQMMKQTAKIVQQDFEYLPLKTNENIVEGNALTIPWDSVAPKSELSYIIGNPPFVGFTFMTEEQKADMQSLFPGVKNLDLVCGWYKKAEEYIADTKIEGCFVSTNSITQGETVARLWERLKLRINFAHKTFVWDSESYSKAHVHCVIIGFANFNRAQKYIYDVEKGEVKKELAHNINAYLMDAPDILVASRNSPLCSVPQMVFGNKPADGGFFFMTPEERDEALRKEPEIEPYIRRILGSEEFINNKLRYCLWLVDAPPRIMKESRIISERIARVREFRLQSKKEATREDAKSPWLFQENHQPTTDYIIIPETSSEKRTYIPIGFMDSDTLCSNSIRMIPDATLYHFGVLTSNVHMAWMRAVCGRLEMRYRYSKDVVYNNFIWPQASDEERAKIEETAQRILDAREHEFAREPKTSLAVLYDVSTMPVELRKAHEANDLAVMAAYGFAKGASESAIVAELMRLYAEATR